MYERGRGGVLSKGTSEVEFECVLVENVKVCLCLCCHLMRYKLVVGLYDKVCEVARTYH